MDVHKNARLTFHSRDTMVRRVLEAGQTPKTVRKWVARYQAEGPEGLHDRSSRPRRLRQPTPEAVCRQILALRRQRRTAAQIAAETAVSPASVSRILKRHGLNRWKDLEPVEPVRRYERDKPGELLHIDIWHRPHGSLNAKTPISRLHISEDNLLRLHNMGGDATSLRGHADYWHTSRFTRTNHRRSAVLAADC